jgi:methyl-accepting chemotaxis protein
MQAPIQLSEQAKSLLPDMDFNFERTEKDFKLKLTVLFSQILMGLVVVISLLPVLSSLNFRGMLNYTPYFLVGLWAYFLAKRGNLRWSGWLLVISALSLTVVGSLFTGTNISVVLFFILPISLAALLLKTAEATWLTLGCCIYTVILYLVQNAFALYKPANITNEQVLVYGFIIGLVFLPAFGALIVIPNNRLRMILQRQNQSLQQALMVLESRRQTGEDFSEQVLVASNQLNGIANKQAGGTQQQLSSIVQFTTSLTELTQTATAISQSAQQVARAIESVAQRTTLALNASVRSSVATKAGRQAVNKTIETNREVGILYQNLAEVLLNLSKRAANIRAILDLIDSVSDETHLLALNATIEAAGAGEYGERFSVIALEVRRLADRTRTAGRDVRLVVEQIDGELAQVVTAVDNGNKVADKAIVAAHDSDKAITNLSQVVLETEEQNNEVVVEAEQVRQLAQDIRLATQQQQSAGELILQALDNIHVVAIENAREGHEITGMAEYLAKLSSELRVTLKTHNT